MDFSAITAGLSAAKTGIDLVKNLREALKRKADVDEISTRLSEVQDALLDAKLALSDASEEIVRLTGQIADLKRMAEIGVQFTREEGVYWFERAPYCPICWDTDRKPVRLAGPLGNSSGLGGRLDWTCTFHKGPFPITRSRSQMLSATPASQA